MKNNEEGGWGLIININFIKAILPIELPAYSAAKAGLESTARLYPRGPMLKKTLKSMLLVQILL